MKLWNCRVRLYCCADDEGKNAVSADGNFPTITRQPSLPAQLWSEKGTPQTPLGRSSVSNFCRKLFIFPGHVTACKNNFTCLVKSISSWWRIQNCYDYLRFHVLEQAYDLILCGRRIYWIDSYFQLQHDCCESVMIEELSVCLISEQGLMYFKRCGNKSIFNFSLMFVFI